MTYTRSSIQRLQGYAYGEQPKQAGLIKLNTNENPYPPSPAVAAALASFDSDNLRLYPDATSVAFCTLAARLHGVNKEQIMATNGGDELLRLAVTTFVPPRGNMGGTQPGYSLYPVLAAIQDANFIQVPYPKDLRSIGNFATRMNAANVRLTCLVNPHAPSGYLLKTTALSQLAEALEGVLLLDEAYVDFVDPDQQHNSISLLERHDNILILRSLSKGYSLAGLRFGYAIAAAELIQPMVEKTKDSYNLDSIAQLLACAALKDQPYAASCWKMVRLERKRLTAALRTRGWHVDDSEANFIFVGCADQKPTTARAIFTALRKQAILVRHFDQEGLADYLRVTIGSHQQNNSLLAALDRLQPLSNY